MKDIAFDWLWPQFLFSCDFSEYADSTLEECLKLQKEDPQGCVRSNKNGWHSRVFSDGGPPKISELTGKLKVICNESLPSIINCDFSVENVEWWANVSENKSFNLPHAHGSTKIAVVYYPQVPKEPGTLHLLRPDVSSPLRGSDTVTFPVAPIKGRAYFFPGHIVHSVESSMTDEVKRVSLAFNFW